MMENKVYMLEHLRQLGYDAYRGSSFSPEKRAQSVVEDYSNQLENDLANISEGERERYKQNYISKLSAYLHAMSRTYSPMISGPANFPVRQMEKRNATVHKRSEEFTEWRERALAAIEKQRLASRSTEQVNDDVWKQMSKHLLSSVQTIINIDLGIERGYSRPLFVKSIVGTLNTWAKNGNGDLVKKGLEYLEYWNKMAVEQGAKVIVTANHSVWKLGEVAAVAEEKAVDRAAQENESEMITDIEIVKNYKIDRLQILFPTKPNEEIRSKLKSRGFRWSPTEGAWQRQLTGNAVDAVKYIFREVGILNETNDAEMLGRLAMHG